MKYRHIFNAGGNYFFTVNLAELSKGLLVEHVDILREVIASTRKMLGFLTSAQPTILIIRLNDTLKHDDGVEQ